MRKSCFFVLAVVWSALSPAAQGAEPKTEEQQWKFQFRICQGDPLGSVDQKTVTVLGAPTVMVLSQRKFSVFVGSELPVPRLLESTQTASPPQSAVGPTADQRVTPSRQDSQESAKVLPALSDDDFIPIGSTISGKVRGMKNGKLQIDLTLSHATVGQRTDERLLVYIGTQRIVTSIKPNETVKFPWTRQSPDQQNWVELQVEPVVPASAPTAARPVPIDESARPAPVDESAQP